MLVSLRSALVLVCAAAMVSSTSAANVTPTKANGDFISGTGIPSDNFTITTAANGESVALKGRLRDTGQALAQSGNVYYVSTGLAGDNVNLAWVFDYQFSPGTSGLGAGDYFLTLEVDFNPATGSTDYATISLPIGDGDANPLNSWDDGDGFFTNPGAGGWSDDNVPYVASNSWHLAFPFWSILFGKSYDANVPGEYQINLSASTTAAGTIASSTILVNVVPEPATIGFVVMGGLFGAAVFLRRRWG